MRRLSRLVPLILLVLLTCLCHLTLGEEPCLNYPDFGFAPLSHNGQLFKLSQTFPKALPGKEAIPAFFRPELSPEAFREYHKRNWREYMLGIRDYCFEGNIDRDWRVMENPVRTWYHMPWQHWQRLGREGLHGLTKEAAVKPRQLATTQSSGGQTYAIAFYNEFAGYLLGKIWADPERPDIDAIAEEGGFANGTVICKILFVDVPVAEVPFLENPTTWKAYVTRSFGSDDRILNDVHLIQMDVMVKDDRSDSGWLFGTYQYNGKLARPNGWDNLVPVGLQWGNDPEVTGNDFTNLLPEKTKINPEIKESVINPDTDELPATHLGWNGRLNGPVDNPRSSCFSCHMVAEYPYDGTRIAPIFVPGVTIESGSPEWMKWYQNLPCMTPFDPGTVSTDNSLQLAMSLKNFFDWKQNRGGGWAHKPPQACHPDRKQGESR